MSEGLNNSVNTEVNGQISLLPLEVELIEPRRKQRGRPPGAKGRWGRQLERYVKPWTVKLVDEAVARALSGDGETLRFLLDRLWPRPKTPPLTIDLPATRNPEELRVAMHQVIQSVTAGELSADEGSHTIAMLRNTLSAYSVQTVDTTRPPAAQSTDARALLFQKLQQALERRNAEKP